MGVLRVRLFLELTKDGDHLAGALAADKQPVLIWDAVGRQGTSRLAGSGSSKEPGAICQRARLRHLRAPQKKGPPGEDPCNRAMAFGYRPTEHISMGLVSCPANAFVLS